MFTLSHFNSVDELTSYFDTHDKSCHRFAKRILVGKRSMFPCRGHLGFSLSSRKWEKGKRVCGCLCESACPVKSAFLYLTGVANKNKRN